jgi:hypothetical protein
MKQKFLYTQADNSNLFKGYANDQITYIACILMIQMFLSDTNW